MLPVGKIQISSFANASSLKYSPCMVVAIFLCKVKRQSAS